MGYPYADLSVLHNNQGYAVKCNGYEEMMIFRHNALKQYPQYFANDVSFDNIWKNTVSRFKKRYHNEPCFHFHGEYDGGFAFCDEQFYLDRGFKIIEMASLIERTDMLEADNDLNLLLG